VKVLTESSLRLERCFKVKGGDFAAAGEAASKVKKILVQLGLDTEKIRKIAIATYEAELNIVIHAFEGEIRLYIDPFGVKIMAADRGPGIADIELAMQEGYSTASQEARRMGFGAGMGLPNMKRCSDKFVINSEVGKGTTVEMEFILENKLTIEN
jgi:anti-sigma regulatory factor (Ser/Thr protein kinase)